MHNLSSRRLVPFLPVPVPHLVQTPLSYRPPVENIGHWLISGPAEQLGNLSIF